MRILVIHFLSIEKLEKFSENLDFFILCENGILNKTAFMYFGFDLKLGVL